MSLLFDTWVNRTEEHMLGFVVATDDRQVPTSLPPPSTCLGLRLTHSPPHSLVAPQVFAFSVSDVTADRESAECLGEKVREVVEKLEKEYSVEVHAITSPAACLLLPTRPDILSVDCAARQLSLVAGDLFKVNTDGD